MIPIIPKVIMIEGILNTTIPMALMIPIITPTRIATTNTERMDDPPLSIFPVTAAVKPTVAPIETSISPVNKTKHIPIATIA